MSLLNTNEWALFVVLGLGLLIPFVIVLREMVSTPKG